MDEVPVLKKKLKILYRIFSVFFSYTDIIINSGVVLLVGINKAQQFRPLFCNPGTDLRHPGTARRPGKDDPDSGREECPGRVS
jgi:hypothetical protein